MECLLSKIGLIDELQREKNEKMEWRHLDFVLAGSIRRFLECAILTGNNDHDCLKFVSDSTWLDVVV